MREINNVLVKGSVREMFEMADFLGHQPSLTLPAEVITELHSSLPPQATRFQELAAVFFANAALSNDDLKVPSECLGRGKQIASVLFHEISEPDGLKRVLRTLVRWVGEAESPYPFSAHVHSTLIPHFNRDLAGLLSDELAQPQAGTICVAWWLAENGERSVLKESVPALRALRMKNIVDNDLIAAGRIIVSYGDEVQFADYLQTLKEARGATIPGTTPCGGSSRARRDVEYCEFWLPFSRMTGRRSD